MNIITSNYCQYCHQTDNDNKFVSSVNALCSRICSHLTTSAKTIRAHPLTSALIAVAIIAGVVAGAVLLATATVATFGIIPLVIAADVAIIALCLFLLERKAQEAQGYKEAHGMDTLAGRITKDQEVCLVIEATEDKEGALKSKKFEKIESKLPIVHVKVSTLEEAASAIDQVAAMAKIQMLWFNAHGCSSGIVLGNRANIVPAEDVLQKDPSENINIFNVKQLASSLQKIEKYIVVQACSTAKVSKNSPHAMNFASELSKVASGRKVIASTDAIAYQDVKIKVKDSIEIGFEVPRWGRKRKTLLDHGLSYLSQMLFLKHDALAVYQDGVLQDKTSSYVKIPCPAG
jgi:hypothetical protein